jgi:hypothetical protein
MQPMASYLISGGDPQSRFQSALALRTQIFPKAADYHNDPDTNIIQPQGQTVGIDQIRQLQQLIYQKSLSGQRFAIIPQAESLTLPAQNAFLKLLEEPPAQATIILTAPSPHLLLSTIVSRCRLVNITAPGQISDSHFTRQQQLFNQITSSPLPQRILLARQLAPDRPTAQEFCRSQLHLFHRLILDHPSDPAWPFLAAQVSSFLSLLDTNTNFLLIIENLLLGYPQTG